jgi:hypothetical protein
MVVLIPGHKDVIDHSCPFFIPRWLQERMAQSKGQQVQNGDRDAKSFLLFLVNLWVQEKSQCFSEKAV